MAQKLQLSTSGTTISFPRKIFCLQISADVSKVTKILQCDLNFIFIKLSETANSFVKISLVLEIKNVTNFTKTSFHCRRGCIKMRKHAEAFHANKDYKLAIIVVYTNFAIFKIEIINLVYTLQTLFTLLHPPNF